METIRNYMESMFARLPNTPEVLRAREELGQMMEDKYMELIGQGKPENEAVAIVISEFGNLEELAETLGIGDVMRNTPLNNVRILTTEEARNYVEERNRNNLLHSIATLLYITCPIGCILAQLDQGNRFLLAVGLVQLFVFIAAAVSINIIAGAKMKRWSFVQKNICGIDFATTEELERQYEQSTTGCYVMRAVGTVLCIFCAVPVILASLLSGNFTMIIFFSATVLVFIGIGVLLLIHSGGRRAAYRKLLAVNDKQTVSGSYSKVEKNEIVYDSPNVAKLMSVYWPLVTCIYLIWSFLSFDWNITWIIWPIAGIAHLVIRRLLGRER